ncbi:hypothetical protein BFP97_11145 [Roseivirga sp. 4D4]|uniref:DUF4293 domain-containing protein n=1 Tax=Roseivirga sp. 4D4 TaxID=1889784 RepID=UPI0008537352|nr:DUF4293 domain-containing protein [Roseivirga sp. 4D4]OEK02042.1 hypothetical protein BFP97_11145 [Roseivirga sp. 4D4]
MIQRFQTVLLLLVAICMATFLNMFIWAEVSADQSKVARLSAFKMEVFDTAGTLQNQMDDEVIRTDSIWYVGVLAILVILVAIFSILQYKNRLNQMKLGALNALFMAATLGLSFYKIYTYENLVNPEGQGGIQIGFYLVGVAMMCNLLSNRFIRKDEKLVKSVDRIR